eukprot:TRINITY_DN1961_c0_g1_i1.p2 TRINITY_DN1961_c0_g1~~TRINITY_DN1961_c0_g1_i1.p2  ORF type:complete len:87 (-),score=2.89 TRINITY_DN1961_c0_g1_i1:200-460(-)
MANVNRSFNVFFVLFIILLGFGFSFQLILNDPPTGRSHPLYTDVGKTVLQLVKGMFGDFQLNFSSYSDVNGIQHDVSLKEIEPALE